MGRYGWAAAAAALLVLAGAGPAQARWLRAESPRFIVYSEGDEASLREYVQQLEVFDVILRFRHGLNTAELPPRKLDIYLVRNHDGLDQVSPGIGEGVLGFYSATTKDVFAIALREGFQRDSARRAHATNPGEKDESIVFHEYTHHFMLQYFPYGYPVWLVEGYAEYFGTTDIHGSKVQVGKFGPGRTDELLNERWVPLRDLLGKPLDKIPDSQRSTFYAQAWLLTHYFMSDPARKKQLVAYMLEVGKGGDPVTAMEHVTGQSAEDLEKAQRKYLVGGLKYLDITASTPPPTIEVTTLPTSADDLLLPSLLSRHGVAKPREAATLKLFRENQARHPGERLAEIALARGEIYYGDKKVGEGLVDAWLATHPEDIEALVLAGEARMDEAQDDKNPDHVRALYKSAAPFLARAYKLDPNRYQTLWEYTRSRKVLDAGYPSDNTLEALLAELEMAPQVNEVRIQAGRGMMLRQRWHEATGILTPLANNPHGREAGEIARKLLKEIAEKSAAAQPAA